MKRKRRLTRRELKRKNKKIIFSIIILLLVITTGYSAFQTVLNLNITGKIKRTDYYVSNTGSDTEGDGSLENPYLTIQKAYDKANNVANIYIISNLLQSNTINMNSNKKITLTSYTTSNEEEHSIIRDETLKGNIIKQTAGNLTIKNVKIDGNNVNGNTHMIESSSTINIKENAVITNAYNEIQSGGGIRITESGKLFMSDGEISNNKAAYGPGISCNGFCEMTGGIIKNNTCTGSDCAGSGIAVNQNATFHMIFGEIKSNNGIGLYVNSSGHAIIDGGVISNNTAAGVFIYRNGIFTINGGIIRNNLYYGILKAPEATFIYNSGIVCENSPSNEYETHETCPN